MIIKIIIPYFGKFPSYFDFFLKSCEINNEIEFCIFTDQTDLPSLPQNVNVHTFSFDEFKNLAKEKLSLNKHSLRMLTPYKLCDYKPTYGLIFEDYLSDADYWGFCDVDLIFGKIFDLISIEKMKKNERILTQGHLTFYKNCKRMNLMFQKHLIGGIDFSQAVNIREPCFFDEIFMPAICKRENVLEYEYNIFADILPQHASFVIASLCVVKNKKNQIFYWKEGKLYREYKDNQNKIIDELIYIHLQKRPLPYIKHTCDYNGKIHITPQGFFTEDAYCSACEAPNEKQPQNYQKKRWSKLTIQRLIIKLKAEKFKRGLK